MCKTLKTFFQLQRVTQYVCRARISKWCLFPVSIPKHCSYLKTSELRLFRTSESYNPYGWHISFILELTYVFCFKTWPSGSSGAFKWYRIERHKDQECIYRIIAVQDAFLFSTTYGLVVQATYLLGRWWLPKEVLPPGPTNNLKPSSKKQGN